MTNFGAILKDVTFAAEALPVVEALVVDVENAFKSGNGAAKKQAVQASAQAVLTGVAAVTGRTLDTTALPEALGVLIDGVVAFKNALGELLPHTATAA